jgi:uncharacterized protein YlzI (FlbEa/FlbD family)
MATFQILTKVDDGLKIAINNERISEIEDLEDCTLINTIDGQQIEVRECIDDIFPDPRTPKQIRDPKTKFIPIKLSSN